MKAKILVIGSGGREHALAYRLGAEGNRVFVSPGNAGIARDFECIKPLEPGVKGFAQVALKLKIDLTVVGPEAPLVDGIVDYFDTLGLPIFGPTRSAARLEESKVFMKEICAEACVATASYGAYENLEKAKTHIENMPGPFVLKADGLCGGKGVVICDSKIEAIQTVENFLAGQFGMASKRVVIEQFLLGDEVSVFALCDGKNVALFPMARDHKTLLEKGQGPNTGGMGAVAPLDESLGYGGKFLQKVKETILLPVLKVMADRGCPYRGFLYAGLMVHQGEPSLLEFNVRFGDPEAQALMFGLREPIGPHLLQVANGKELKSKSIVFSMPPTCNVVLAANGYPEKPEVGEKITGLENSEPQTKIFFAGVTPAENGDLISSNGRVLSVCSTAGNLKMARQKAYEKIAEIQMRGGHYRKDIGASALLPTP